MLEINKTIIGISTIEIEENEKTVTKNIAYMNATIPQNGECTINKVIQERNLFSENREVVLEDFNQFEKYVYELTYNKGVLNE